MVATITIVKNKSGMVAHACNSNYSGGGGRRIESPGKKVVRPSRKQKGLGVA
jgi:hypothetical protein